MSMYLCPHCRKNLIKDEKRYYCPSGHSFDISASGYVHLLPANQKNSLIPGDDKLMAAARNRFLNGEYYSCLRNSIADLALKYVPQGGVLFDSGCGEGYYTAGSAEVLRMHHRNASVFGVDISKFSLRWAAKRDCTIEFAVASAFHLPFPDNSVDFLINCFSPNAIDEFSRVLKPGGVLVYVVPAPKHMWELKSVLYDEPYENEEKKIIYEGFHYIEIRRVEKRVVLPDQQTIQDLFGMTPYYFKTPKSGKERLAKLDQLEMLVSFDLHVFQRDCL